MKAHTIVIQPTTNRRSAWLVGAALFALVLALVTLSASPALADQEVVVTLGANLNEAQQQEMLDLFGVKRDAVPVLTVTNQEERDTLQGLVPLEQIGSRAISSVYVKTKGDGSGIDVQTKNITYVTEQTYANALVTAGVKDAEVYAAAPFGVSGTAALTGVFKAFEEATGQAISEDAKQTATEELVGTAEVGQQTGDPDAVAELMQRAKEQVVERGLKDEGAIRLVVINISNELNLNLTDQQVDRLTAILVQVQNLNISLDSVRDQLKDFQTKIGLSDDQAQGILAAIQNFFRDLWSSIFG